MEEIAFEETYESIAIKHLDEEEMR